MNPLRQASQAGTDEGATVGVAATGMVEDFGVDVTAGAGVATGEIFISPTALATVVDF